MAIKTATFKDYYTITKPSPSEIAEFKDYFVNGNNGRKKLIVEMEATHAGLPLNNPRYYIPSRMEEGTPTIEIGRTPMKICTHHNTNSIPVGKTLDRQYVHTIPDDLVGNPDVLTLTSPVASMKDQLKAMRNLRRAGVLDREDFRGLGHIKIKAEISESAAVEALEDGRLDAISTNFDPVGEVYCSICGQNLYEDRCEHEHGEMYFADGMEEDGDMKFPCQYIPGKHKYLEASLVVLKGDPLAVIDIVDTQDKDKNETIYMSSDSVVSGHSTFQFKDSVEEDDMIINGKEVNLTDTEQKVFDQIKKLHADMKDEEAYSAAQKVAKVMSADQFVADVKEAEIDEETALLYAIEDTLTSEETVNGDEVAEEMRKELSEMKEKEEISEEEFEAADAKLSSEKRKKLPESAFCGPDRLFPVPDCAHVTAARRLIGRYKGPGSKASILACVSRKAKALGCDSKEDTSKITPDNGDVEILPCNCESVTKLNNDDLQKLFHAIELELIDRKQTLKRECSECAVHQEETDAAKKELGEARDELAKSENVVTILRSELRRAAVEYEAQVDAFVQQGLELNTAKVEKLAVVSVLTQKYDTLENAMTGLKDSNIEQESKSIMDSFDIKKITDKLNDGMSRTPQGTVNDPTNNADDNNQQLPAGLSKSALEAIDNIKDCLKRGETSKAKHIYDTINRLGMFNDDLTFESLSADSNPAE